jgi:hypothetical protein
MESLSGDSSMRRRQFPIRSVLASRLNCAIAAIVLVLAAAVFTVSAVAADEFIPIDIQPQCNGILSDSWGSGRAGSNLSSLPAGPQVFDDTKFYIGEQLIQLGSTRNEFLKRPEKVEGIKVDCKLSKLHFLQAVHGGSLGAFFVKDNTLVGEYRVNFDDHSAAIIPIVYGIDVRDWFYTTRERGPDHAAIAWVGDNECAKSEGARIRLYKTTWENPWPNKRVTTIDFSSRKTETLIAPFCVAITAEQ